MSPIPLLAREHNDGKIAGSSTIVKSTLASILRKTSLSQLFTLHSSLFTVERRSRNGIPLPSALSEGRDPRARKNSSPLGRGIKREGQPGTLCWLFPYYTLRSALCSFLAFCLLLFATGCSRTAKVERHLARGQNFFKAEQYDKAEIEFLNVLRLEQTNAVALRDLGLTYHQQGKWLRSYAFLQKAHEVAPQGDEVQLRLATILLGLRNLKGARAQAEAVLLHDAGNEEALMLLAETAASTNDISAAKRQFESSWPQAEHKAGFHLALGIVELRERRMNEASAAFQRALSLDPKSSPAHLALGNLAELSLDNAKAEFHFKRASELAPLRSNRRLQYADFKLRSGDLAGAGTSLEEITGQAPDYVPAYVRLADIALTERQFDQAATLSKKILALDPGNYDGLLLSARVRVGNGDARGALADFERLATAYPRIPQVHYHVATAHLLNENPARASTALQQALALDPQHIDSILVLAEINIRQNNAASAISSLRQLVQQQPQVFQAHLTLARAYRSLNQGESAAQVYNNMAELFPNDGRSHFAWGQLLLAQRKADAARQKFERSLELTRDFLPAIEELANLDIAAKQFAAAEKRIADAIARNPKTPGLLLLAAKIHSAQTNHIAAEQALSRAIVLDPNYDPAYLALARVYVESNRPKEAVEKLNALVARSTNNIAAWLQLGIIHHQSKSYPAARDAYEKLLTIDPRFFPALNNLASLYSENLNQLDRAHTLARSARDQRPDDPVVADTLGWVLFRRGEYSGALPLLQQSSEKLTKSSEVQFHLGMTHYMLGNEPAARSAFERSLAGGQDFPGKAEAQNRLALLSKTSAEPVSLSVLEKQLADNPRDPALLTRLAAAYEQAGAFDKAVVTYNTAIQQNPRNVSAMLKLAQLYAGPLRDSGKALQIARNARAVAPEDRGVAQILGRLAFQSGDYKWSLSLLEEAARGINDRPEPLYDLAWARYSAGRVTNAVFAMQQALAANEPFEKESDAKRFLEMNTIALSADKSSQAAKVESALKQDGSYVPALFASAMLQQRAGDAFAARRQYQAILKRFPDFLPAHKGLAILLSRSADEATVAFQHAIKAREALPDDSEVAGALGIIAFHRKDYSRAVQLLKESLLKAPTNAEAYFYLGMAHFHLGEKDHSRIALQKAIAMDGKANFASDAQRMLSQLNSGL